LQVKPHAPLEQVAVPFTGAAHGVQDAPQLAGVPSATQLLPHA
jgi:hypothetical protein